METMASPSSSITPGQLSGQYRNVRAETERRCGKLQPEDYVGQPVIWVSPPKWHLAHTTWFFERFVLKPRLQGYKEFDPQYNFLFNSYYETIGERLRRDERGLLSRPPVSEIYAYRAYVDEAMQELLSDAGDAELQYLVVLGLQHEQQHQELLVTDTKYILSRNPLLPVWDETAVPHNSCGAQAAGWLPIPGEVYEIGFQGTGFCFDNELGRHKQYIHSCSMMDRPVSAGEFLEFVETGGYQDFRHWLSDGWEWVRQEGVRHPLHWHHRDGKWMFYHLNGLQPLDPGMPAMHLNYYEADAYARWKGLRLPTEFEWEAAAGRYPQAFANQVWEWTQSAYLPYPGYRAAPGAVGEYNGKFMVNQMVLRGGSFATPAGHSRHSYRNFFPPQMQWQFSGFRLLSEGSF